MLTKTYVQDWAPDSVWIECTPSQFAMDSLFFVQEIGRFECYEHFYAEHEGMRSFFLVYTEEGTGEYYSDGSFRTLAPGDLMLSDCMDRHMYRTTRNGPWQFFCMHFNGSSACAYYDQFMKATSHVVQPSNPGEIRRTLSELIRICQDGGPYAELHASEQLTHLLTLVLVDAKAAPSSLRHVPAFVEEAVRDIHAHLRDDLTLDNLARTLGVNKYHLQKEFKRYIGMSPNTYVCSARINAAKSLLRSNELTVSQVAEQAGFRNVGHFMNMFKRTTGMTPGEYRRHGVNGLGRPL